MKRKTYKIMAFLMCLIMCLTNITPTMAASTIINSIGSINQEDDGVNVGVDKTQTQQTMYSEDIEEECSQNTNVYVSQASTFGVFIPKTIVLSGEKNENGLNTADYVVSVSSFSNINGTETINVVPEESFEMTSYGKNPIVANVTQDKVAWKYNELDVKANGVVSTSAMTAGMWNGFFRFNISLGETSSSSITVIAKDENGVDLNASSNEIVGDKKDNLLNALVESGFVSSVDDVDALIDVESDQFDEFAETTFDVSSIAQQGDTITILHFDETKGEWEYISTETVDENGKITANFTSFSPVAFVKGDFTPIIPTNQGPGLYNEKGFMLCSWEDSGIDVEIDYSNYYSDSNYYQTTTTSAYYVINNKYPTTTKVVLPENTIKIGTSAFLHCKNITDVCLSTNVTSIGYLSFASCTNLKNIENVENVITIDDYAFQNCENLTSIDNFENITTIGTYAFASCKKLTNINLPQSVQSIEDGAFIYCSSLTSINVNANNQKYNSKNNCNAIIETKTNKLVVGCKNTTIPSNVVTIADYAFAGAIDLKKITIPNNVTSIGYLSFAYCDGITSIGLAGSNSSIELSNNIKEIGYSAFKDCINLTTVNLPNSITNLRGQVFSNCSSLSTVTLPNKIGMIEEWTFHDCVNLTAINIPNSVEFIGREAFFGCENLVTIKMSDNVVLIESCAFGNCNYDAMVTYKGETLYLFPFNCMMQEFGIAQDMIM